MTPTPSSTTSQRSRQPIPMLLLVIFMLTSLSTAGATSTGTIEIWPSERRKNHTLFCYGNDWNSMLIQIDPASRSYGLHPFELPEQFIKRTTLKVMLPDTVKFLGADIHDDNGVQATFQVEPATVDGKRRQLVNVVLDNDVLNQRLLQGNHSCYVFIWFDAPETLDDTVDYKFLYDGKELAKGSSRLVTAGVLKADRAMPKRFGFYPWRVITSVPNRDFEYMADFFRRMGVKGMFANAPSPKQNEDMRAMLSANTKHGIKNIAEVVHFVRRHGGAGYLAKPKETLAGGGLVNVMDEICEKLESAEARADWEELHGYFDMAYWDWEPHGPRLWQGYDDPETIAAFARKHAIEGELTTKRLQTEYRDAYARFRMEQIARPLFSLMKTIRSVGPMHFRVEQGEGIGRNIDYELYDEITDAHSPMIYQRTPFRYAQNLVGMLANTSIPARKFWPTITLGYPKPGVYRESPQALMMDTVITAASGCGGLSHWPSVYQSDASWYGIYEGMARIAPVEDFYLDGKSVQTISMKGLPYREEVMSLGHRTIDLSAPDWRSSLITLAHQLGEEYGLTLLNYHQTEEAFIKVNAPELKDLYLVNPVDEVYQTFDPEGKATVQVDAESPSIWIATADKDRIAGYRLIEEEQVQSRYRAARDRFLSHRSSGEMEIGTKGDITTKYGVEPFGGEERVCLKVQTPEQEIAFGSSGGRIYDWKLKGMDGFVGNHTFESDGMAKDLLWLPVATRWSGDEVQEYALKECSNNGREARIVYEADFKNAFPGLRLRKVYTVQAKGTSIHVEVTLQNDTVDQVPLEISYWSHHTFDQKSAHFVGKDRVHQTRRGEDTLFTAHGLEDTSRLPSPGNITDSTHPAYAEFFPDTRSAIIFKLPPDFMNVHRWSHRSRGLQSSEWMSRPFPLAAGMSKTFAYSMTAVPDTTVELLQASLASPETTAGAQENLFPYSFDELDNDHVPVGWNLRKSGEHAETIVATAERDETGEMMMKVELPLEGSALIHTAQSFELDPHHNYAVVTRLKVRNMLHSGTWYRDERGIRIWLQGDNAHTWLAVAGAGSTNGWVTGILPFPTGTDENRRKFARLNLSLRCLGMTGTVFFQTPEVIKLPDGVKLEKSFVLEDGSTSPSPLRLSRTSPNTISP